MSTRSTDRVHVQDLCKRYGRHEAVSSLSFDVKPGELVGLLGPNGSGKTSTLHMLAGLAEPTSGVLTVDGRPPTDLRVRRSMGVLPDDLPLPVSLTGTEFLDLHDRLRAVDASDLRYALTDLFGLDEHLHRPLSDYSHGMKRKVQIVAAVAHRPSWLLLDEPLRGLDPEAEFILRDLVGELRKSGTGVLLATHDIAKAGATCDRVVVISLGHLMAFGPPAQVCAAAGTDDLEQAFLALTGLDRQVAVARTRVAAALR